MKESQVSHGQSLSCHVRLSLIPNKLGPADAAMTLLTRTRSSQPNITSILVTIEREYEQLQLSSRTGEKSSNADSNRRIQIQE